MGEVSECGRPQCEAAPQSQEQGFCCTMQSGKKSVLYLEGLEGRREEGKEGGRERGRERGKDEYTHMNIHTDSCTCI